ncbi:MAG: lactate utilization protein [Thermodesulfobacteriota bacterium]|jgi:L-lactate utilization protein LutB|nr:MAG: lactate utilization protein [Thermodesulfobacteriota bacterium]
MDDPIKDYWRTRLKDLKEALEANNFEVFIADNAGHAKTILENEIISRTGAKSVSWGGSMTFINSGLYEALKDRKDLEVVDTYDKSLSDEQKMEKRRAALLVDLFIMGTNAITQEGELVNLDMIGNRVGGLIFGPKNVVILVGRNKIVPDLEAAMGRIKNYVAPINTKRLGKKTPCVKTSYCEECQSEERICNAWTIIQKSFPKKRVKVVLINEDLGL